MNKTFFVGFNSAKGSSSGDMSACAARLSVRPSSNRASDAHMMYDTSQHAELHSYITQSFCHLGGAVKTTSALAENARGGMRDGEGRGVTLQYI